MNTFLPWFAYARSVKDLRASPVFGAIIFTGPRRANKRACLFRYQQEPRQDWGNATPRGYKKKRRHMLVRKDPDAKRIEGVGRSPRRRPRHEIPSDKTGCIAAASSCANLFTGEIGERKSGKCGEGASRSFTLPHLLLLFTPLILPFLVSLQRGGSHLLVGSIASPWLST